MPERGTPKVPWGSAGWPSTWTVPFSPGRQLLANASVAASRGGLITEDRTCSLIRPHPWLACRASCGPHDPPNDLPVLADHVVVFRPNRERAALRCAAKQEGGDFERTTGGMATHHACFGRGRVPKKVYEFNSGREFRENISKQAARWRGL